MRLNPEIIDFFKCLKDLKGFRNLSGLNPEKKKTKQLHFSNFLNFDFFDILVKLGNQKIDIVSFTFEENDPFKNYILDYAIKLAENKAQYNHGK